MRVLRQNRPKSTCWPTAARGHRGKISSLPGKRGPRSPRRFILGHNHFVGAPVLVGAALKGLLRGRGPAKAAIRRYQHDNGGRARRRRGAPGRRRRQLARPRAAGERPTTLWARAAASTSTTACVGGGRWRKLVGWVNELRPCWPSWSCTRPGASTWWR